MFHITITGMKLETELQIVQADVRVEVDGDSIVEEAMCVDVGLPALLYSCFEPTNPNRWAAIEDWRSIPFFVCGCGDPECRAIGFRTRLVEEAGQIEWVHVEQSEDRRYREQETYLFDLTLYREQVLQVAERFLTLINKADYRPLMGETVKVVRQLTDRLRSVLQES